MPHSVSRLWVTICSNFMWNMCWSSWSEGLLDSQKWNGYATASLQGVLGQDMCPVRPAQQRTRLCFHNHGPQTRASKILLYARAFCRHSSVDRYRDFCLVTVAVFHTLDGREDVRRYIFYGQTVSFSKELLSMNSCTRKTLTTPRYYYSKFTVTLPKVTHFMP